MHTIQNRSELLDISIMITEDVFSSDRAFAGVRIAHASQLHGNQVHLILVGKSVELALKKNKGDIIQDKWENRQLWLEEFFEEGGRVHACYCYCYNHNITEADLLRYVPIVKTEDLVEIITNTKIHLVF